IHVLRMWSRGLKKIFGAAAKTTNIRKFWTKWVHAFIKGNDMWSVCRRMKDVLTIFGSSYFTSEVQDFVENFHAPTIRKGSKPWDAIDLEEIDPTGPFFTRTPFGHYAKTIADGVKRKDAIARTKVQSRDDVVANPYYSVQLFDYVLHHFLPYSPLLNRSLFNILDLAIVGDNTNTVEYWITILKRDTFRGARNQRISRLTRSHYSLMQGQINHAIAA
ncbi:unnamed protein product, partial [Allacma fusca]